MLWFAYETTGYSSFLRSKSNNMSARRVVDNGLTTAIAVDKDKHSQNALKWALENIVADYTHCVLLHVQPKGIFCSFTSHHIKTKMSQDSN